MAEMSWPRFVLTFSCIHWKKEAFAWDMAECHGPDFQSHLPAALTCLKLEVHCCANEWSFSKSTAFDELKITTLPCWLTQANVQHITSTAAKTLLTLLANFLLLCELHASTCSDGFCLYLSTFSVHHVHNFSPSCSLLLSHTCIWWQTWIKHKRTMLDNACMIADIIHNLCPLPMTGCYWRCNCMVVLCFLGGRYKNLHFAYKKRHRD